MTPNGGTDASLSTWQRDWKWLVDRRFLVRGPELPESLASLWTGPLTEFGPLEEFFSDASPRKTRRVGFYVEALIASALSGLAAVSDLRHSIPVRKEKQTLGELDFLFSLDKRLVHLEVALKYYLFSENRTALDSHFIGPNAGDTLERKAKKLLEHQLPLGKRVEPDIDDSLLFCPGLLFYHPAESPPRDCPDFLSPDHDRGTWLHVSEWQSWVKDRPDLLTAGILEKPFWLGADPNDSLEDVCDQVRVHFSQSHYPLLLALEGRGLAPEAERVFIVSDQWPERPDR